MPIPFRLLAVSSTLALTLSPLLAMAPVNVAEDSANQGMYGGGWNDGTGGDNGFLPWKMVSRAHGDESFAGHYLAHKGEHPSVEAITTDRAFALFANGHGYEESVAFRGIAIPIEPGDHFSFDILHGPFIQKGAADDSRPGEVGVAYRAGNANESVDDAEAGARLVFFAREGSPNYLITDSETAFDTGIPITKEALSLTLTLVDADTYDLEIISLRDNQVTLLEGRKFGGDSGKSIDSLAFFNRNAETHDFSFNNFQLSRQTH